jgi:hypothetical protein
LNRALASGVNRRWQNKNNNQFPAQTLSSTEYMKFT